jgi:hypothetical protein
MLDGLSRWRDAIFGALIGFRENFFRLRRGIVAPSVALLGEKIVGSTLHSIWVGSVRHHSLLPDSGKNNAVATGEDLWFDATDCKLGVGLASQLEGEGDTVEAAAVRIPRT